MRNRLYYNYNILIQFICSSYVGSTFNTINKHAGVKQTYDEKKSATEYLASCLTNVDTRVQKCFLWASVGGTYKMFDDALQHTKYMSMMLHVLVAGNTLQSQGINFLHYFKYLIYNYGQDFTLNVLLRPALLLHDKVLSLSTNDG